MVQLCHTFLIILKALEEQVTKLLTYYALFVTIYLPKISLLNKYKRKENICVNFYLFSLCLLRLLLINSHFYFDD